MKPAVKLLALFVLFGFTTAFPAAEPGKVDLQAIEFFEKKVRPVLVDNCVRCHGDKKAMGGLRLDSKDGMIKGTDTGPVIVPGQPERSPMIQAVRHAGEIKMPPMKKMRDEAIADLVAWVKMGAPWPESKSGTQTTTSVAEARKSHWAFRPITRPAVPTVQDKAWAKTNIDHFILAQLEAKKIRPQPEADRRTLIRRVTFDLIGLPPTPEEVATFEADPAPDAYEKLIDRLLASPQYGERWGRHWLDVARYSDTKGYVFTEERRFPFAYTYRDYVIQAFNQDLPFNQFILHQLAADQLDLKGSPQPLAAMGYLTLGRRFLNNIHDIIDDRIDTVSRGLLGLTVSCARCHDHKFDPIPTRDYYSLYGVFFNSVEPKDLPLLGEIERNQAYLAYEKELQAREQKLNDFTQKKYDELMRQLRAQVGDYLIAVREAERLPGEDHYEALNPGDLNPEVVRRWQAFLAETKKKPHSIFSPWHAFSALPQKDFKEKAPALAEKIAKDKGIHPLLAQLLAEKPPQSLRDLARGYGELFASTAKLWQEALVKDPKLAKLPDPHRESLRQVLYGDNSPTDVPLNEAQARRLFDRNTRNQIAELKKKVDEWKASQMVGPPRAMVLNDRPDLTANRVLIRGNPNNQGDVVPRQFLEVLAADPRQPFKTGSGRLELARAIASPDNPLTARVIVNRIWHWHFGHGIVRTPSDFGLRGERPTHPELLDYLASQFIDQNWSLKKLHRQILLSAVYRQQSNDDPKLGVLDPDNRLLWKMNRHRLDFEQLRDSLLFAAGRLDKKMGGAGVDIIKQPFTTRRTVYGYIERQNLPGLFRTFDFASPDTSTPLRYQTTVPQQALFLLNSPFVIEQAKFLAKRVESAEPSGHIEKMYQLCYGRKPEAEEVSLGIRYVQAAGNGTSAWEKYAQVLLLSNEFAFVD